MSYLDSEFYQPLFEAIATGDEAQIQAAAATFNAADLAEFVEENPDNEEGIRLLRARMLADEVPVFLNLVSKAEQGYYLAGIYRPEPDQAPGELSVTEFLQQLSLSWLLQKPLNCPEAALLQVKNAAIQAGVQVLWDEIQPITGQHAVPELIEKAPRLGALQLALAAASATN